MAIPMSDSETIPSWHPEVGEQVAWPTLDGRTLTGVYLAHDDPAVLKANCYGYPASKFHPVREPDGTISLVSRRAGLRPLDAGGA